jgi:DNA-binding NarL/FixJ family response regulator
MLFPLINIAIVDDHTIIRKVLKNFLAEQKGFNIIIQSPDIPDLLNKLKNSPVNVLVMDVLMPQITGFEAAKLISDEYPNIKIVVLSMCTDMRLLSDLLEAGVYAILSKSAEPDELVRAITSAAEGRIYQSKLLTDLMYWDKQRGIQKSNIPSPILLSEREKVVLRLLWEEKSNKEIAEHLFLGIRSVEKIRQDLKEKIGAKSTVGLLKYAIDNTIIKIASTSSNNILVKAR